MAVKMEDQWGRNGEGEGFQVLRGVVQLEKMKEKAEEWAGKTEWMSRKDGQIEVERGRLVWELPARPSLEHAAEIFRDSACFWK